MTKPSLMRRVDIRYVEPDAALLAGVIHVGPSPLGGARWGDHRRNTERRWRQTAPCSVRAVRVEGPGQPRGPVIRSVSSTSRLGPDSRFGEEFVRQHCIATSGSCALVETSAVKTGWSGGAAAGRTPSRAGAPTMRVLQHRSARPDLGRSLELKVALAQRRPARPDPRPHPRLPPHRSPQGPTRRPQK
jgi:hypothetical protein